MILTINFKCSVTIEECNDKTRTTIKFAIDGDPDFNLFILILIREIPRIISRFKIKINNLIVIILFYL